MLTYGKANVNDALSRERVRVAAKERVGRLQRVAVRRHKQRDKENNRKTAQKKCKVKSKLNVWQGRRRNKKKIHKWALV